MKKSSQSKTPSPGSTIPSTIFPSTSSSTSATTVSSTMDAKSYSYCLSSIGEYTVTLFLIIYGFGISTLAPFSSSFIERDPALSQPFKQDTVTNTVLILLSFILPLAVIIVFTIAKALYYRRKYGTDGHTKITFTVILWTIWWICITLVQAMGVALASTNTIKNVVGRQRPAFFDLVNYAGYTTALDTNNYNNYNAATVDGSLGDLSKVYLTDNRQVQDAQRSFPSGHASISFAGMSFLVGYLRWWLQVPKNKWFTLRGALSCCPLILSGFIAVSRVRDRKHNPDDISIGTLLGLLGGLLSWLHYHSEKDTRDRLSKVVKQLDEEYKSSLPDDHQGGGPHGNGNGENQSLVVHILPSTGAVKNTDRG